jgi:hypothetical protein
MAHKNVHTLNLLALHLIAVKDLAGKFSAVPADTLKHCALKL